MSLTRNALSSDLVPKGHAGEIRVAVNPSLDPGATASLRIDNADGPQGAPADAKPAGSLHRSRILGLIVHAMTREEYEAHKQRLEEQLQAGIEILKAAHDQQARALDVVWMITRGGTATILPPPGEEQPRAARLESRSAPASPPLARLRRRPWELMNDIESVMPNLPGLFDRNHVREALGYEPDRGSLYRTLQEMVRGGDLTLEDSGGGKTPARYRKAEQQPSGRS